MLSRLVLCPRRFRVSAPSRQMHIENIIQFVVIDYEQQIESTYCPRECGARPLLTLKIVQAPDTRIHTTGTVSPILASKAFSPSPYHDEGRR